MDPQSPIRVIRRSILRPPEGFISIAKAQCSVAAVLDQQSKYGALSASIKPLNKEMKVCGPAITCLGKDLLLRRAAIDLCQKGDVLVMAAGGDTEVSCFGEQTARHMMSLGIAGVVIDGSTRDSRGICELGFPTFVKGVTARNHFYPCEEALGAVNVPVSCGGVIVCPGDLVLGDADGVAIVPRDSVPETIKKAVDALKAEDAKWNARLGKPYGVEETLRKKGFTFSDG